MKIWSRSHISIIAAVACPERTMSLTASWFAKTVFQTFFTQTQNTFNWFQFMLCILKKSMITLSHHSILVR